MPARDICEPQVVAALENAGWIILDQPLTIRLSREEGVLADIRARFADKTIIVVEVKCFTNKNVLLDDFYHAVGQYLVYRNALRLVGLDSDVFLAIPAHTFDTFFQRQMVQAVLDDVKMKLLIVDLVREEIVRWIG